MTTNALSIDLEEYFHVSNFEGVIDRNAWDRLDSRLDAVTDRLLDTFEAQGSRATFFVLGWVAERHPKLVRRIAERGHEVASHGYAHELVYELGPAAFREDLRRARGAIEQATGNAAEGYRAPSFSITERSLWAFQILAEEGFHYDSSVFPVRHPRYGIPGFAQRPVELELDDGRSICEFPLTTLRVGPFTLPLAGGAYFRFCPGPLFRWGFRKLARDGEPTVLYLHPWELDPDQPRQATSLRVRVNHYYNLAHTEQKLRALLSQHRFAPLRDVLSELRGAGQLPLQGMALGHRPARAA